MQGLHRNGCVIVISPLLCQLSYLSLFQWLLLQTAKCKHFFLRTTLPSAALDLGGAPVWVRGCSLGTGCGPAWSILSSGAVSVVLSLWHHPKIVSCSGGLSSNWVSARVSFPVY